MLKTVNYVPHESISLTREIVETGEIMVFVGPEFVVTVRHGNFGGLVGLRKEMEAKPGHLGLAPYAVMHAVAQHVVHSYRDITTLIEADIDTVQEETFAAGRKTDIEQIYLLKREIVELRRAIRPLSAALERITTDHQDLVPAELMGYMRDVVDHQRDAAAPERNQSQVDARCQLVGELRAGLLVFPVSACSARARRALHPRPAVPSEAGAAVRQYGAVGKVWRQSGEAGGDTWRRSC